MKGKKNNKLLVWLKAMLDGVRLFSFQVEYSKNRMSEVGEEKKKGKGRRKSGRNTYTTLQINFSTGTMLITGTRNRNYLILAL